MARKSSGSIDEKGPDGRASLWLTADKLRNNLDVAGYRHVQLGLIFLGANHSGN